MDERSRVRALPCMLEVCHRVGSQVQVPCWCRAPDADRCQRQGRPYGRPGPRPALAADVLRVLRAGDRTARGGRAASARGGGPATGRWRGHRVGRPVACGVPTSSTVVEPDGHTRSPVPLALGEHGRIRADGAVTLSNERLGDDEVVDLHGMRSTRRERATFDEMRRTSDLRESVVAIDMMAAAELDHDPADADLRRSAFRWKRVGQVRNGSGPGLRAQPVTQRDSPPADRRARRRASLRYTSTARSMIAAGACSASRTCWTRRRAWSSSTTGPTTEARGAITRTSRRSIGSGEPDSRWRG